MRLEWVYGPDRGRRSTLRPKGKGEWMVISGVSPRPLCGAGIE